MKRVKDIENKLNSLTGRNKARLESIRHPHRNFLKYYPHRVGLTRLPTLEDHEWLEANTTGNYSVDYTTPPHNLSFEVKGDAVKFKLTFGGDFACKAHQPR